MKRHRWIKTVCILLLLYAGYRALSGTEAGNRIGDALGGAAEWVSDSAERAGIVEEEENGGALDSIEAEAEELAGRAQEMYRKYGEEIAEETNEAINEAVESAAQSAAKSFFESLKQSAADFWKKIKPGSADSEPPDE